MGDQPRVDTSSHRLPANRKLVVIQRNPTSGSGGGARQLKILIRRLRESGFRVRLFANRDRFDEFVHQPQQASTIRCLVAAGGDGTIASLANRHARFPIAILPLGTENLMSRHLGIRQCGRMVARLIQDGATRLFDTGVCHRQHFLLMCSVGLDADVVRRLHSTRQGNIRHFSYFKPILLSVLKYPFPPLQVFSSDGTLLAEGTHVIATNVPEYGFRMPFCPTADPHDGLLDVRVFKHAGRLPTFLHAVKTRLGFQDRPSELIRFQAAKIEVRSDLIATAAQSDGDPADDCPVQISIAPSSMTLVVRSPEH